MPTVTVDQAAITASPDDGANWLTYRAQMERAGRATVEHRDDGDIVSIASDTAEETVATLRAHGVPDAAISIEN